jgi:hypothetical protein
MTPRHWLPATVLSLALVACDNPVVPNEIAGYYRLERINGQHVPATIGGSEFGFAPFIARSDLLILPEGTFELQVAGSQPALFKGTARGSGGSVTLAWQFDSDTTRHIAAGIVGGDSIALTLTGLPQTLVMVFRRFARRPPDIADGTYVLATINGNAVPAASYDATSGGVRYVRRVDYDTIILRNGLFYSRARKETQLSYQLSGDSAWAMQAFWTNGTFTSVGTRLVLSDNQLNLNLPDTLAASGSGLTATGTIPAPWTAVYLRR